MKPIKQLVPDLEKALDLSLQQSAVEIANQLIDRSPRWTEEFADNWKINLGDTPVVKNMPTARIDDGTAPAERKFSSKTAPNIKKPPRSYLKGYTIGNTMEYAEVAQDLVPGPTTRSSSSNPSFRYERTGNPPRTGFDRRAPKNWFTKYARGSILAFDIQEAFEDVMTSQGFKLVP